MKKAYKDGKKNNSATQSRDNRNISRLPLFANFTASPKSRKNSLKYITQLSTGIEKAIKTQDNHVPVYSDKEAFEQASFGELILLWL